MSDQITATDARAYLDVIAAADAILNTDRDLLDPATHPTTLELDSLAVAMEHTTTRDALVHAAPDKMRSVIWLRVAQRLAARDDMHTAMANAVTLAALAEPTPAFQMTMIDHARRMQPGHTLSALMRDALACGLDIAVAVNRGAHATRQDLEEVAATLSPA